MKNLVLTIIIIFFLGCTPFEYEYPELEFHSVTLDATKGEYFQNGYYLFKIDDYITQVAVGEIKSIHFEYYNGLICQYEMNRIFNCKYDSISTSIVHNVESSPLADIIRIKYSGTLDSFYLARNAVLYPDYFTVPFGKTSFTKNLPAKINSDNRLLLYKGNSIVLDTTFFVGKDTITFEF